MLYLEELQTSSALLGLWQNITEERTQAGLVAARARNRALGQGAAAASSAGVAGAGAPSIGLLPERTPLLDELGRSLRSPIPLPISLWVDEMLVVAVDDPGLAV